MKTGSPINRHDIKLMMEDALRMAGMDGIEALQRILDMDNTLPVILNTAYSSYRENYLTWSADAYITKSSDTTELLGKVKELLDARMVEN